MQLQLTVILQHVQNAPLVISAHTQVQVLRFLAALDSSLDQDLINVTVAMPATSVTQQQQLKHIWKQTPAQVNHA